MMHCNNKFVGNSKNSTFLIILLLIIANHIDAHLIQIEHDEFGPSTFARPLYPSTIRQFEQHHPAKELTAAEHMVDLTNDLAYRLLHFHSILNRNNFAASPTALMSVLISLYEGSSGRSAMELQNVLQLPKNRDIIRVGYRDIHRRLRTYFFGSENPLKGLSLNKENVTITSDYETVLMFYGYDLSMDMVSTAAPLTTTAVPIATENATNATESTTSTSTTITEEMETTTEIISTTEDVNTTTSSTTTIEGGELPTDKSEGGDSVTETVNNESTTNEESTTMETTPISKTTEATSTESQTGTDEVAELVSKFPSVPDAEPLLRIQKARVSRLPSGKLQAPLRSIRPKSNHYLPSGHYIQQHSKRNKRHLHHFKELDASLFVTLFHPHARPHHNVLATTGPESILNLAHLTADYEGFDGETHYLAPMNTKQNYNTDVISHVFYLHNNEIIHTTFKVYNAVLYHKYFDNMKMNVLELELDTPEYNLVILLPDFHTDLVTAAASLRFGPTLRLMRKQLKPRWVQAIIPDFKLFGNMFLTNDLQNMGIKDIFEPNRADFRVMTDEKGIYVRHIEQLININIRTHPINQLKRNYGQQQQPIQLSVNHPFLFFIVDRDLDIAVMAGRILNPLNVRIQ